MNDPLPPLRNLHPNDLAYAPLLDDIRGPIVRVQVLALHVHGTALVVEARPQGPDTDGKKNPNAPTSSTGRRTWSSRFVGHDPDDVRRRIHRWLWSGQSVYTRPLPPH